MCSGSDRSRVFTSLLCFTWMVAKMSLVLPYFSLLFASWLTPPTRVRIPQCVDFFYPSSSSQSHLPCHTLISHSLIAHQITARSSSEEQENVASLLGNDKSWMILLFLGAFPSLLHILLEISKNTSYLVFVQLVWFFYFWFFVSVCA